MMVQELRAMLQDVLRTKAAELTAAQLSEILSATAKACAEAASDLGELMVAASIEEAARRMLEPTPLDRELAREARCEIASDRAPR